MDLSAAKMTEFSDRVVTVGSEKILPVAAIYGANASGKSNIYNAFEYMFVLSKGKPKALNFICDKENKTYGSSYKSDTHMNPENRKQNSKSKTVAKYSRRHNVWDIAIGGNKTKHPAVFPESLANDHIITWSNEGDLVFDPFVGSGTTGKMAILNNRNFIGIDIDNGYCEMAKERIESAINN